MDWGMIFTALASASGLVASTTVPVWLSNRKTRNEVGARVAEVHEEVRTNHGKSAGEYIENIAGNQEALFRLLVDHTAQDAVQFHDIKERLNQLGA